MKHILFAAIILGLASCKKDKEETISHTQMAYTDLSARVVNITTPAGIDISGDGVSDAWFEIWHTHDDAQNRDIHQFVVSSGEQSKLLANAQNASPIISRDAAITGKGDKGYSWKAPAVIELAKRTLNGNEVAPVWEGAWKQVQRQFLAVQVIQNGSVYNGWIELSFDTATESVILHRSGISKEKGRDVAAGK